jgi:hypothetical protein
MKRKHSMMITTATFTLATIGAQAAQQEGTGERAPKSIRPEIAENHPDLKGRHVPLTARAPIGVAPFGLRR